MRILLVDDDEILIDVLQKLLGEKNYTFDAVFDGEQGWTYGSNYSYDLVILDWSLPKLDGISLCKRFRSHGYEMPILLLTAHDSNQEKIIGLDAGADDYLCKPFNVEELGARIRALLRRNQSHLSPILTWEDLQLDTRNCQVVYQQKSVSLTTKEYQLLELFLSNPQFVFSIEDIIDNLWSSVEYPCEATVRSHLRYLRQKLKKTGVKNNPIETLRGRGYCLKFLPPNPDSEQKSSSFPTDYDRQPAKMSDQQKQHLEALAQAWKKYQPKISQQLTVLQNALLAWQQNDLIDVKRQEAKSIAHKLAGMVGVFGFDQGSKLAKQLEELLENKVNEEKKQVLQFETIFNTLHQQLTSKHNSQNPISKKLETGYNFSLLIIDDDRQFIERLNTEAIVHNIETRSTATLKLAQGWLQGIENKRLPNAILLRVSCSQSHSNSQSLDEYLSFMKEVHSLFPLIPIIVIADRDRFEDRLLLAKNGATFYLKQPITPSEAIVYCQQAVQNSCQEKKVMIVDDDRELLELLPCSLEPWGLQVTTLNDPRQFWDVFKAITPDLLILDIEMPHLSGIELCQVLRTNPQWYKLPVLYFSIHQHKKVQNQLCTSNADELVHKSVGVKQLASRIAYHLQKQQTSLTIDICSPVS